MNVLAEMWNRLTGRGASAEAALAAEARSREEIERMVADLGALRDEVKVLWDSRNQMMAQILRLKSEVSACRDQIAASVNLFEQRTDQIYEGVMHRLPNMVENGHLVVLPARPDASDDAESQRREAWKQLIAAGRGDYIAPREIPSPLTLSGLRVDHRLARETLDFIEIFGVEPGLAVFGPSKRLLPGSYVIGFICSEGTGGKRKDVKGPHMRLEAVDVTRDIVVGHLEVTVTADLASYDIAFAWGEASANSVIDFRVRSTGNGPSRLHGLALSQSD